MGYFSNGTEGMQYEEKYCARCVHHKPDGPGCAVWLAHMLRNYEESNKKDSILHILIPQKKDGGNEQCAMFHEANTDRCPDTPDMFTRLPMKKG